jgi:hypothetical protein
MTTNLRSFYLPTRPYSVIDCINRRHLATGSLRNASRGECVDYNGHHVSFVEPNQFKPYWTCYYTWAGIRTIGRGTLADCLRSAKAEYDRGALGATATVSVATEEDAAACLAAGFVEGKEESMPWFGDMHKEVSNALWLEEHGLCPVATSYLANSKTLEEYKGKIGAFQLERRAARGAA